MNNYKDKPCFMLLSIEAINNQNVTSISVAVMRKLRRMSSKTRKKRIRNEDIIDKLGITSLEDKLRENRLK